MLFKKGIIKKRIRLKLIVGFLIGVLSIGSFSVYAHYKFGEANALINERAETLRTAQLMALHTKDSLNTLNLYLFIENSTELELLRTEYAISSYNANRHLTELRNREINPELLEQLGNYSAENERILQEMVYVHDSKMIEEDVDMLRDLQYRERVLLSESQDIQEDVQGVLDIIIDDATSDFERVILEYDVIEGNARIFLFIIILYSAGLAIFIANSLNKPISYLRDMAIEIGKGNLNVQMQVQSKDELGELASEFNRMAHNLKISEITIKKQNRELMNVIGKLRELDRKKDEFISISSHELKTPLSVIKGFLQLIRKGNIAKDKKTDYYFDIIDQNASRLNKFIFDLVDTSRMSLGKLAMDIQDIDPNELFKEMKVSMSMMIEEKKLKPDFRIDKDLPKIKGDKERILQVMRNLITNAVKFTERGEISVSVYRKGKSVQFEVKDMGMGIPKKKQKFIFSKFYQVDSSFTREFGGTGLGLAVCKGLVENMKGRIWFESVEGKGSTFYFTLPVAGK